jgi:hypothetical protein
VGGSTIGEELSKGIMIALKRYKCCGIGRSQGEKNHRS